MSKNSTISVAVALMVSATPICADELGEWDYRAFVYLWGPALGGTTSSGENVELSFSDVLDNLEFGIMGALEANKGPFSYFGDFQYLDLETGQNAAVGPGIPAVADANVTGFVFTGSAGYDLHDHRDSQLVVYGGFRYLGMDTVANISVGGGSQRISGKISNVDAVIGLRGSQRFSEKWALSYIADVGAGGSDLTWQVGASIEYRINNWDLSIGYRHMAWELGNSSDVLSDLSFSGPIIGAKIAF